MPTRQQMWEGLAGTVDLLIIGGGINGAGIARDAARRGLKVAMIEMNDLAWGTSSRSSKLVHGGIRYLEQLEFSLVFEAVSERRILLDIAPHLVNPLGFLFPVYKNSRRNLSTIQAGMWLYDGLSLFRSPKRHRVLKVADIKREEPALTTKDMKGSPLYYDCSTDDARLTLENALDAAQAGAHIVTWAKVESFIRDGNSGRAIGANVRDVLTGKTKQLQAHAIINATGPWTDLTLREGKPLPDGQQALLRPTKGVHIVVNRDRLPVNYAVVCFHPQDGRVLFAIPWGEQTYIGTTDTDYKGDPGNVYADGADVDYLIHAANSYFPNNPITREDVISTWAGLRPLIRPVGKDGRVSESAVSREHEIIVSRDTGIITIAGGKLTTYRKMSAEVVDKALQLLRLSNKLPSATKLTSPQTESAPLPGAVGWPDNDDHAAVAAQVRAASGDLLSPASALLLTNTYGMLGAKLAERIKADPSLGQPLVAGRPEVLAQVDWAVEHELAATVSDVFMRRTQIFYRDRDQGLSAVDLVASRMAKLLGWDTATAARHAEAYRAEVAASRRWQRDAAQNAEAVASRGATG
jgi:glycerol-3-phosphate dehydrogenase